jgi:hypothetical protein
MACKVSIPVAFDHLIQLLALCLEYVDKIEGIVWSKFDHMEL